MSRFLVLFELNMSASEQMASATADEIQSAMQRWVDWKDALEADGGVMEFGSPLESRVQISADGSVVEFKQPVSGYLIVDKRSLDQTVSALKSHPHLAAIAKDVSGTGVALHRRSADRSAGLILNQAA